MHSPKLLTEILEMMLDLDISPPSETKPIQDAIEAKKELICSISKFPREKVDSVISARYQAHVQEAFEKGRLIRVK